MAAECTLDLPALAVAFEVLPTTHLSSVLRWWPSPAVSVSASRNDRLGYAELFAAQRVIVFGVVPLVAEKSVDGLVCDGLAHRRCELR